MTKKSSSTTQYAGEIFLSRVGAPRIHVEGPIRSKSLRNLLWLYYYTYLDLSPNNPLKIRTKRNPKVRPGLHAIMNFLECEPSTAYDYLRAIQITREFFVEHGIKNQQSFKKIDREDYKKFHQEMNLERKELLLAAKKRWNKECKGIITKKTSSKQTDDIQELVLQSLENKINSQFVRFREILFDIILHIKHPCANCPAESTCNTFLTVLRMLSKMTECMDKKFQTM